MQRISGLGRRKFIQTVGTTCLASAGLLLPAGLRLAPPANAQAPTPRQHVDHTIRIAPVSHELAPGKIVKTTAYNGSVPGPALRLPEGKPVTINVVNDSG
jgi:FtsP/CotA-like multicopper oxidase with cupredoxin domain